MGFANVKRMLAVAILSSFAFAAFADDAPVYEVDNYPPPFDGQTLDTGPSPLNAPSPIDAPVASSGGLTPEVSSNASQAQALPSEPYVAPTPTPARPPRPLSAEQRMQKLEQQIKNLQQSSTLAKAEELQKEVQSLRGQLEEMSHQVQQMQSQQKAMYADFDSRLAGLQTPKPAAVPPVPEAATAAVTKPASKSLTKRSPVPAPVAAVTHVASAKPVVRAQPNAAEEQQIYQTAYDLIKAKKYNDAIATLQKMLQKYPSGSTAANAHYWLGELYGLLNKNVQSANEFSLVVKKYPNSSKASDAQLKLGLIYVGQFKWGDAKTAFKGVVTQYPGTASARLASEQLRQMKKAGH